MDRERASQLHRQLGRLLETTPNIRESYSSAETQLWIGRVTAIVEQVSADSTSRLSLAKVRLGGLAFSQTEFMQPVYDALARLENELPGEMDHPAFLPAASPFDAHRIITDIVSTAKEDLFFVDRYQRDAVLKRFAASIAENVRIRLLTTVKSKAALAPAAAAWRRQYVGLRAVEVRIANPAQVHDRLIIVDSRKAWTLTQSFGEIAESAPAEIIENESNVSEKIEAYEDLWLTSEVLELEE